MVLAVSGLVSSKVRPYFRHSPQSQVVYSLDDFPQDFLRQLFDFDKKLIGPYINANVTLTISNGYEALEDQRWDLNIFTRMGSRNFQVGFEKYNVSGVDFYRGEIYMEKSSTKLGVGPVMMKYLMDTAGCKDINYLGKKLK